MCVCIQSVLMVPKQLGYREDNREHYRRTCHKRGRTLVLGVQCPGDSRNQEKPTLDVSFTDTQIQQDSTYNSNNTWWNSNFMDRHINMALGNIFSLSGIALDLSGEGLQSQEVSRK